MSCTVSCKEAYLVLILIYYFAEDWFQRSTRPAGWGCVQHYDDSVALMVQLPKGKLPLMSALGDVKLVVSSSLGLFCRLQILRLVLHI